MTQGRSGANRSIPAGYTYLGQFIDHDLTFDTTSRLGKANDPADLTNLRSPRLDLDSVYGRAAATSPTSTRGLTAWSCWPIAISSATRRGGR